jgi:cob(I)alamin adenosyltransferase
MAEKSKLYTKRGDDGTTSLVSGNRVHKSDLRIDLYGDLDELNSLIGFCLSSLSNKEVESILFQVQKDLFVMGSNMACEEEERSKFKLPQLQEESILLIESMIDQLDEKLPALTSFILPGGSETASRLHLCRTYTRKLERKLSNFDVNIESAPDFYIKFLNRLSDFFFVASRYVNFLDNMEETKWP